MVISTHCYYMVSEVGWSIFDSQSLSYYMETSLKIGVGGNSNSLYT